MSQLDVMDYIILAVLMFGGLYFLFQYRLGGKSRQVLSVLVVSVAYMAVETRLPIREPVEFAARGALCPVSLWRWRVHILIARLRLGLYECVVRS